MPARKGAIPMAAGSTPRRVDEKSGLRPIGRAAAQAGSDFFASLVAAT
jgi:hypothetical protein